MRLSQIKMAGFKSFVDPITIRLPGNLVGVVGPNGCGKSNIIDAVRWVMGESSKHLRGDTMEDVIFNGSTARRPVGQASIELVFDNSDGAAAGQYAKYRELALRRTLARDGQSKYFLNGVNCRRRDVTDIFLGTGLGPRSYAIIEQGMISRLIEARPEDLRVYLEEAAGISKYNERRRETENRIRHACENVSRLNDLREEVDKQIDHLQRQAKTAEKFKALKQEERRARAILLGLRWRHQQQEATTRERLVNEQYTRQEAAVAQLRGTEAEIEKLRARHAEANEAVNDVQARYYRVGGDISRIEQAIQHQKALRNRQVQELEQVNQARQAAEIELSRDREALARLARDIANFEPKLARARTAFDTHTGALTDAEKAMAQWQAQSEDLARLTAGPEQAAQVERARIEHLERQLSQLNRRRIRMIEEQRQLSVESVEMEIEQLRRQAAEARAKVAQRQEQLQATMASVVERREHDRILSQQLSEMHKRLQQASGRLSALEALQEAALGKHEQAVVQWLHSQGLERAPRLAEQLKVIDGWERALETVLGYGLEAVCVENLEDVIPALVNLRQGQLQLLDTSARGRVLAAAQAFAGDTLASKVDAPPAVKDMLAQVYLAASLSQALSMRQALAPGASVVTADGVWVGHGWLQVTHERDEHGCLLAREVEIKGLRTESASLDRSVEELQIELACSQKSLQELERAREQLQAEVNGAHRAQADVESRLEHRRHWQDQIITRNTQLAGE
ncbi:MAG TPA: chromosome segregation protein SMC, partial [Gammaproteobacteria bacterium]|nr:chromosome segregation protein SMC [Gammaproteobacteria bacterium]